MGSGTGPRSRWWRALGALGAVAVVLLIATPTPAAAAGPVRLVAAAESIASYDVGITVRPDGRLRVTETIAYDFGTNQRHGIFRRIPVRFTYDSTRDRQYALDNLSVSVDGGTAPVQRSTEFAYQDIRIGDPDHTITGTHTYVIGYTVDGVLNHQADHEELYWNAIGNEWTVPIAKGTVTVTGPAAVTQVQCYTGPDGSQTACADATKSDATANFDQADLPSGSGLSVVVGFPVGSVTVADPVLVAQDPGTPADPAGTDAAPGVFVPAGPSLPAEIGAAVLAVLGVVGVLGFAWRTGRDRRFVGQLPGLVPGYGQPEVEARKSFFGQPPVSVEFVPPDDIRPGQAGTIIDEQADVIDVTATIVDLAVRKHLRIVEVPGTEGGSLDWRLERLTDGDPAFLPYERTLFDALFHKRTHVTLSDLTYTFNEDQATVRAQLYQDAVDRRWYRSNPKTIRHRARFIGWTVLVGAVIMFCYGRGSHWDIALLLLALVPAAIALLIVAGKLPARTGRGSAVLARVQGFRLYIATAEAAQIRFEEREQIFSRYLPYAIVFGLADRWAGIFAKLDAVPASGLYWYAGQPGWNVLYLGTALSSFSATTATALAATPPTTGSSGASGFSGVIGSVGGFSGGGAGGGGGGSW
jgi:Predicted membrane protein (DUF2207)